MDEEKWRSDANKRIRFMANEIWHGVNYSDVEQFLNNFSETELTGYVLLDMLIYYSLEQESSIIDNLLRLLSKDLWQTLPRSIINSPSDVILAKLDEIYHDLYFVPVKDKSDPSCSAYAMTASMKKSKQLPNSAQFIELLDVPIMLAGGAKYFVFYDDLIGTGKQFRTFWSKKFHFSQDRRITLNDIAQKHPCVKFYYLVIGACEDSMISLQHEFPNIKIITSELFSSDYSVLSAENEYWELYQDLMTPVQKFIRNKESELQINNKFSKYLPVLFEQTRAQNTSLSLYWYDKNDWKAFYRR